MIKINITTYCDFSIYGYTFPVSLKSSGKSAMKCPNCSSIMYITDKDESSRSLVTFYRCSNCIGKHVSSEPLNQINADESLTELFASSSPVQHKQIVFM